MQSKKSNHQTSNDHASDSSDYYEGDDDWWMAVSEVSDESLSTPSKINNPPMTATSRSPTPVKKKKRRSVQTPPRATPPPAPSTSHAPPPRRKFVEYPNTIYKEFEKKLNITNLENESPPLTSTRKAMKLPVKPVRGECIVPDSDEDTDLCTDTESKVPTRNNSLFTIPSTSTSMSSIGSFTEPQLPDRQFAHPLSKARTVFAPQATNGSRTDTITASPQKRSLPKHQDDIFSSSLHFAAPESRHMKLPASKPKVLDTLAIPRLDDPILQTFSKLPMSTELETHVIAHNSEVQKIFDELRIEWGTQYELARGVILCAWTWADVKAYAAKLTGPNEKAAPRVLNVMQESASAITNMTVWKELDREQKAILENRGRGLGLMGAWEGDSDWHGGQIQQLARLTKSKDQKSFEILLEPMEKRRSHRFARFCGSRRILQIRLPKNLVMNEHEQVKEFLKRKFVLLGRVFVPFQSKDGGVYMVETNEDWERMPQEWCGDVYRLSFMEFMDWHNPLIHNANQAMSKFVTRYALGLSNSVPALEFKVEHIRFIDDVYADDWPVNKPKAPAEKIMTDGCGFINLAGLTAITKKLGYDFVPSAIQGRIDGSKGLWLRHPTDASPFPQIWIRKSQNKISNPVMDRAHRIFELLTSSHPSDGSALSKQSILNLYHNEVPSEVLVALFEQGLVDVIMPLLNWTKLVPLWDAINKVGSVSSTRAQRVAAGASRALGFQRSKWGDDDGYSDSDDESDDDEVDLTAPTYTGRNQHSGAPLALHEKLLELIQAGFKPKESQIVQDDIKKVIEVAVSKSIDKYRIPVRESVGAFVVPDPFAVAPMRHPVRSMMDPLGILQEGQIYYRSSRSLKDPLTEMPYEVIKGDVVIGRYPMYLPSDLQKVTAVDVPELASWTDVLIVSVKGDRSLASLLSGGDMDGDHLDLYREPNIVNNFKNRPFTAPPDDLMEANFERDVESVPSFCSRLLSLPLAKAQQAYQEMLLLNIQSSQKGLYSSFHENATAKLGYGHPETVRLAYIFNTLLDASKTGHRLKPGVFEKDQRRYGQKPGPFGILAELRDAGNAKRVELLEQFRLTTMKAETQSESPMKADPHLIAPYRDAAEYAQKALDRNRTIGSAFYEELDSIRRHVEEAYKLFMVAFSSSKASEAKAASPLKKKQFRQKTDQEDLMLKATGKYAEAMENIVLTRNLDEVKASYAYQFKSSSRFAFTVAFRDLCLIKAKASGIAPITREFDECKSVSSSSLKALARNDDEIVF